ncbi:MAG TPA: acetate/propionate family kinase [Gammaproteobacteria bacterium]|nr:acetate/propionate family kinase [Gammaproteobacteria bacterium]
MKVLVVNAGSSSHKARLYAIPPAGPDLEPPNPLWSGALQWGRSERGAHLTVEAGDERATATLEVADREEALDRLLATLFEGRTAVLEGPDDVAAVGHRVVHGGPDYSAPAAIDAEVYAAIDRHARLAPEHNPLQRRGIDTAAARFPGVLQVAVFDTAFHRRMPDAAANYGLPYSWTARGIHRYGFHGISHRHAAERAAALLGRPLEELRLVTCHLGNGASLAAVHRGWSVDTTMGFTPLEGLMMGTRSGSLDPAIPLYLQREHGLTVEEVERLLNRESGLYGVSGISGDMREVLEAANAGKKRARFALDLYVHQLRRHLGAMLASLEGLDAVVFTGGVGEHAATIRSRACRGLAFAGLWLDQARNAEGPYDTDLAEPGSGAAVFVVAAREEWAVAREAWRLAARPGDRSGRV